jgi:hypothetical protein
MPAPRPISPAVKQAVEDACRAARASGQTPIWAAIRREVRKVTGKAIKASSIRKLYKAEIGPLLDVEQQKRDAADDLRRQAIAAASIEGAHQQVLDELNLCRNVGQIGNTLLKMLAPAISGVAALMKEKGADLNDPTKRAAIDPSEAFVLARRFTAAFGRVAEVLRTAQEMERVRRGDPLAVLGVQHGELGQEEMSLEEARRVAQATLNAIATAERLGLFHAQVDGPVMDDPTLGSDEDLQRAKLPQVYDGGLPWKSDADQVQCPPAPAAAAAPAAPRHLAPVAASSFMASASGGGVPECPPNPALPTDDREPSPVMKDAAQARISWGHLRVRR